MGKNKQEKSWKESLGSHQSLIIEYFKEKREVQSQDRETPIPELEKLVATQVMVTQTLTDELNKAAKAEDSATQKIVPAGWTDTKSYQAADTATAIALVAAEKGLKAEDVVRKYAQVVAKSKRPDFFDTLSEFRDAQFMDKEQQVSFGKEILAEVRARHQGPAAASGMSR